MRKGGNGELQVCVLKQNCFNIALLQEMSSRVPYPRIARPLGVNGWMCFQSQEVASLLPCVAAEIAAGERGRNCAENA